MKNNIESETFIIKNLGYYSLLNDDKCETIHILNMLADKINESEIKYRKRNKEFYIVISISLFLFFILGMKIFTNKKKNLLLNQRLQLLNKSEEEKRMRAFILKKSEDYIRSESKKRKPSVELPVKLWEEVLREFNSEFNNIAIRLKIKYPKLTDRQIILACLIKTGLDSYTIIKYLGLSKTNFRIIKFRMKNTLNISGNKKSLENFLKEF